MISKKLWKYIFFDALSLEELAFICGLSLSTFKRNFQAIYEQSPAKFIREKRLHQAAEWLISTDLTVSEIAYKACFNDLGSFSKAFKAYYYVSPKQYRLNSA